MTPRPIREVAASKLREIDRLCAEFDAAWKAGRPRPIEEFLKSSSDDLLLRRLIAIELPYRHRAGERPTAEEYRARFPKQPMEWLGAMFATSDPAQTVRRVSPSEREESTTDWRTRSTGETVPAVSPTPQLPRLGRYLIRAKLGAGGMGEVYRATDPELGRDVALKAIIANGAITPDLRKRFEREARALAAIKSEYVVTVHDFGFDAGQPFLVMELLRGEPLSTYLRRRGPLSLAEVLRLGEHLALGLAAAHEQGLIHRDVKPSNVWLESLGGPQPWRAKLLDFGLSRLSELPESEQLTRAGALLGTPPYMAPEQLADPERATHKSDLFGLGCVLYEAVTGQRAFPGEGAWVVPQRLAFSRVAPVREHVPDIPAELSELIERLLDVNPDRRPASAADVAASLYGLTTAVPDVETPSRRARRSVWLAVALATAGIVALAIALIVGIALIAGRGNPNTGTGSTERAKPGVVIRPSVPPPDPDLLKRDADRAVARWVLSIKGGVVVTTPESGEKPAHDPDDLPKSFNVSQLSFFGTNITDADLKRLELHRLHDLETVDLTDTEVTDVGVRLLATFSLKHLKVQNVRGVTDLSAESINKMTTLQRLNLKGTGFTEDGLKSLTGLKNLMSLEIDKEKLTEGKLNELQKQFDKRCVID